MDVLLVCPLPVEFNAFRAAFPAREGGSIGRFRSLAAELACVRFTAVESGAGKPRAAAAVEAACLLGRPHLVVDSGTCAGLAPELVPGDLVLSTACVEYDLGPDGTPAATQLPPEIFSSLLELDSARRAGLEEGAVRVAASSGVLVRSGLQACGERAVRSTAARRALHRRFHAAAANWETAGVFAAARRNAVPALSLRVVTDLGDEAATRQFRLNARRRSRRLYEFVRELTERGWFAGFQGGARC